MARPIILDVDTGTDDALAILYAVAHPDLDVRGITCVAGNAGLDQVVGNSLKVLDAAGAPDIPVAAGAKQPLIERIRPEGAFHGADGLGGVALPDTARRPSDLTATELLRKLIMESDQAVTLVALAPQTNLALLLTQHPEVRERLEQIVFMGGSAGGGNMTAVAEFNVWQDPEAATCVIESGIPTSMYGLDVFNRVLVDQSDADRLRANAHPALRLAGELLYRRGLRADGSATDYVGQMGDAGALVLLTDPDLFTIAAHPVRVNLAGIGRGQTIVDRRALVQDAGALAVDPWPRINVTLDGDVKASAAQFVRVVETLASVET
jgi:pyrimidine-specific ribonucleoside hydrolase